MTTEPTVQDAALTVLDVIESRQPLSKIRAAARDALRARGARLLLIEDLRQRALAGDVYAARLLRIIVRALDALDALDEIVEAVLEPVAMLEAEKATKN